MSESQVQRSASILMPEEFDHDSALAALGLDAEHAEMAINEDGSRVWMLKQATFNMDDARSFAAGNPEAVVLLASLSTHPDEQYQEEIVFALQGDQGRLQVMTVQVGSAEAVLAEAVKEADLFG